RSVAQLVALNRASLKQKSGIWRDLAVRHRRTEVDMQLGAVVEIGRGHGLRLPLNERLIELIHDLEAGRRHMSPRNVDDLRGLNRTAYPAEVPA
ncbi:MAG TPA: ketopantoate reductase C-terminal domain-containing protein, partial [bacterium]|nr:ketopantoate reductase C-terminal domain-containing protein [bacterium]